MFCKIPQTLAHPSFVYLHLAPPKLSGLKLHIQNLKLAPRLQILQVLHPQSSDHPSSRFSTPATVPIWSPGAVLNPRTGWAQLVGFGSMFTSIAYPQLFKGLFTIDLAGMDLHINPSSFGDSSPPKHARSAYPDQETHRTAGAPTAGSGQQPGHRGIKRQV